MAKRIFETAKHMQIGGILKEKREGMGLTLDEIERRTLISKRYLTSIENDDISVFPKISSASQVIRGYARFLGFEDSEIANIIKNFNPRTRPSIILFGPNTLIYIILLLILFVIAIIAINL
ncbi:MAG: helix-turn-helix domain-containing protein [bacterium]